MRRNQPFADAAAEGLDTLVSGFRRCEVIVTLSFLKLMLGNRHIIKGRVLLLLGLSQEVFGIGLILVDPRRQRSNVHVLHPLLLRGMLQIRDELRRQRRVFQDTEKELRVGDELVLERSQDRLHDEPVRLLHVRRCRRVIDDDVVVTERSSAFLISTSRLRN